MNMGSSSTVIGMVRGGDSITIIGGTVTGGTVTGTATAMVVIIIVTIIVTIIGGS